MKPTIHAYLRHIEAYGTDQTAFCTIQGEEIGSISYATFVSNVKRFASRLTAEYPDIHSRHIGLLAKNSYAYIVALFGIWCAGGAAMLFNTDELRKRWRRRSLLRCGCTAGWRTENILGNADSFGGSAGDEWINVSLQID